MAVKPDAIDSWRRAGLALDEVLELDLGAREKYLARVRESDPELGRVLAAMVDASGHTAADLFEQPALLLAAPLFQSLSNEPPSQADPPAIIGPYRTIRRLARGGMGEVYLAERADGQFEQRVALKLVKRGMDSEEIHRRFLDERQILARLAHPHIARLLDGGVAADGRPYIVMEYVDGDALVTSCDARRLTIDQRLELFQEVCEAVRFAHQNLVVHRDLKPSNILVTAGGEVKLLDFGIAKVLGGEGWGSGAETRPELRVMTPEYAAPEQVRGEPVTTATDVYALGAVLYELLTGRRAHQFRRHTPAEIERVVCQVDPEPPSGAVAGSGEIGAARRVETGRLRRLLRGDLDTIVLKALHKEPARRYASADSLLDDIRRYRAGLPVRARPSATVYRARKFLARHRLGAAAAAAVFLALVGGLAATAWQARHAAREATKATEVKNFVKELFGATAPDRAQGHELTARELLDRGTRRVDSALARQPEVQLELLDFLGQVHRDLGYYGRADSLLRRALILARRLHGPGGRDEARELATWGTVLIEEGEYARAESVLSAALANRRRVRGEDSTLAVNLGDLAVALQIQGKYAQAEPLAREALSIDRRLFGSDHLQVAADLDNLGVLLWKMGKFGESGTVARAALEVRERALPPTHPLVTASLHNLAGVRLSEGSLAEAERLEQDALARARRLYPGGHPDIAIKLEQLYIIVEARGRFADAEAALTEAVAIRRQWLGPAHPQTMEALANLGVLQYRLGNLAAAERAMREGVEYYRRTLGREHPTTATLLQNLGAVLSEEGKYAQAEPLLREGLALRRKVWGDSNPDVARTTRHIGLLLQREGRLNEAERALRQAVAVDRAVLPSDHPQLAEALSTLGGILTDQRRAREAEPLLHQALAIRSEKHGATDPRTLETASLLGTCLAELGRDREAEPLLLQSYHTLRLNPYSGKEFPGVVRRLASYYDHRGKRAAAAAIRQAGYVPSRRAS
ncbi:MAG TPA: serine/threonine-protein kinase [Gemmatimonadales bacterium]|nr:serine/threonine-protein kinase [Gemmatimonadales bacterium]